MPNVNIVKQTRDKYVLSWIMYIWHETLIFCHIFCMVAKAMRDPFYKIDWLTDLSLVLLLISNLTNELRLHQFLRTF